MESGHNDVIRASEVGEYVHCHRAWWLGHVEGVENANSAVMEAGTVRHRAHGAQVQRAGWMQNASLLFVGIAVVAGILLVLAVICGSTHIRFN